MWNIAIQSCWQLVVITHELIYGVRAVYLSGKNYCERGLFLPNRRQPGAVPCQTGLGANVPWFVGLTLAVLNRWTQNVIIWGKDSSVHENHRTCQTFPMARPKCLMRDFTNFNRIYKAHIINVWWTMNVFQLHWDSRDTSLTQNLPMQNFSSPAVQSLVRGALTRHTQ